MGERERKGDCERERSKRGNSILKEIREREGIRGERYSERQARV